MINFITDSLESKIDTLIANSREVKIVTAFLKMSGLKFLNNLSHKNVTLITGIDFFITDPEAVNHMYNNGYSIKIFHETKKTFHPKCIYIKNENKETLIIGSSNITYSGLNKNYEASIILDKDFTDEKSAIFNGFVKYFNNLLSSKYCFDVNSIVFEKYTKNYNKYGKINDSFNDEIEKEIYKDDIPINDINEINQDDWIFHNKFGLGRIITKNEKNRKVYFIEDGSIDLRISNSLQKVLSFDRKLLDKYFAINGIVKLNIIINEYKEKGKKTLDFRYGFYKKWKEIFNRYMTQEEIYSFFEDSSEIWTLMMLKKNILSSIEAEFNNYIKYLRDESKSIFIRFEEGCKKVNGIGPGITSTILSILHPEKCVVYNNANNDFLEFFNIEMKNAKGKNSLEKYYQYSFFTEILKEKYDFKDLIEVDCFIGYVKVNYLKKQEGHFV